MRGMRMFAAGACLPVVFLGLLLGTGAADAATLQEVRGSVELIPPGTDAGPAREGVAGAPVRPGDAVRTGPDSWARILLDDGSRVEVFSDTELVVDRDPPSPGEKGNSLLLSAGRIFSRVTPRERGGDPFRVVTPSTVCGIRGTVFTVAVARDGASRVGVEEGEVEVKGAGKVVALAPGRETLVEVGARPALPVPAAIRDIDWDGWLQQRNEQVRKRGGAGLGPLVASTKRLDGRAESLQRRLKGVEDSCRDLARRARGAAESGEWGELRRVRSTLAERLEEGVELARIAGEVRNMREAAVRLGERVADSVSSPGEATGKKPGKVEELRSLRSSLAEKAAAEGEVLRKRFRKFQEIAEEHGLKTRLALAERGIDEEVLERWKKFSAEEREQLRERYRRWRSIPPERRQEILQNWKRFEQMSRKQRREVLKNLREFQRLDSEQRAMVREKFRRWRELPQERREEIRRKYRQFLRLSPRERESVIRRLRGSPPPQGGPLSGPNRPAGQ